MAKALLCPDCGHRHRLDTVGEGPTFRCAECRRLLKVPAAVAGAVSGNGARRGGAGAAGETTKLIERQEVSARVPPSQRGEAIREQERRARARAGARATAGQAASPLVRIVVWLIAVPVGLGIVLAAGRALGVVTVDDAVDIYIGVGFDRFVAPLVLLPVWAAVSGTLAHLALEAVTRSRRAGVE